MKLFIYIFLVSNLIGEVATLHDLEPGKRDKNDHNEAKGGNGLILFVAFP